MFKGRHFDQSVILLCVRWYLAYNLSLRDLEEMMAERGVSVDHSTVHHWVVRFAPQLLERFNRRQRTVTGKWHMDETYIKVGGRWMYLYRAIDSVGDTVEFRFSEHRDLRAAKCFFRKALQRHGLPEPVFIDGSQTNREAIIACDGTGASSAGSGQCFGFKSQTSAAVILAGRDGPHDAQMTGEVCLQIQPFDRRTVRDPCRLNGPNPC